MEVYFHGKQMKTEKNLFRDFKTSLEGSIYFHATLIRERKMLWLSTMKTKQCTIAMRDIFIKFSIFSWIGVKKKIL